MDRFQDMKPWQAFRTFAIIFSFVMNLVLLIVFILAAPLLIPIIQDIANPLVGGLNDSFVDMSEATISRTIDVNDDLDISFSLPLETETNVVIVSPVALDSIPAQFVLPDGGGMINGAVTLSLPRGLTLPVQLDLDVPVDQTIPVEIAVDVDIPLDETELGGPFNQLRALFEPLARLLNGLPASNDELIDRVVGRSSSLAVPEAVEANASP